ncbi:hypothetical protein PR202_gb20000 [Eleusine coracana subsp. coracana]|uniref:Sec20 C-terminal domain-containing protein n=1 Tax=Eleusine coracana subsp. coracana TaxID=191504 RepID=A0AAV5FB59_ELECO|nr:hypothetical protein PR202_gb20000 [Eleusine coracana subsp. coracana]
MDKRSNFGSLHTVEAAFGLLERLGCDHFHEISKRDFPIGADARDNLSNDALAAAKRLAIRFWRDHGREAARQVTVERLAQAHKAAQVAASIPVDHEPSTQEKAGKDNAQAQHEVPAESPAQRTEDTSSSESSAMCILGCLNDSLPSNVFNECNAIVTISSSEVSLSDFKAMDVADAAEEARSRDQSNAGAEGVVTLDAGVGAFVEAHLLEGIYEQYICLASIVYKNFADHPSVDMGFDYKCVDVWVSFKVEVGFGEASATTSIVAFSVIIVAVVLGAIILFLLFDVPYKRCSYCLSCSTLWASNSISCNVVIEVGVQLPGGFELEGCSRHRAESFGSTAASGCNGCASGVFSFVTCEVDWSSISCGSPKVLPRADATPLDACLARLWLRAHPLIFKGTVDPFEGVRAPPSAPSPYLPKVGGSDLFGTLRRVYTLRKGSDSSGIFRRNGFQKMDKIKDSNRQAKQLEDLTGKMKECKRLIKEFDRILKDDESNNSPEINKQLNDRKQFMIKELNSYVTMRKHTKVALVTIIRGLSSLIWVLEVASLLLRTIFKWHQVVAQTVETGTQTAQALSQQTEQMKRIGNELDSVHFSLKKASQLVKEIGRQVATDKCIMAFLFLIDIGVIAVIVVKVCNAFSSSVS